MKKRTLLFLSLLLLAGCSPSMTQPHDSDPNPSAVNQTKQQSITIQLKIKNQSDIQKDIQVAPSTSALEALKQTFEVKETNGFVTEIEGHANDDTTQTYWMYEVNGEMAQVGANEYILNDHDTLTWIFEPLK